MAGAVENPKTCGDAGAEPMQAGAEQAKAEVVGTHRSALLRRLSSEKGVAVAQALAMRRPLSHHWRADHSTFSALNIDGVQKAPRGSPFAELRGVPSVAAVPKSVQKQSAGGPPPTPSSESRPAPAKLGSISSSATALPTSDAEESDAGSQGTDAAECGTEAAPGKLTLSYLLGFRGLVGGGRPEGLEGLAAGEPGREPGCRPQGLEGPATGEPVRGPQRLESPTAGEPGGRPTNMCSTPSKHAYNPRLSPAGKSGDLRRTVQSLLNKICPENVGTIVERIAAVEVSNIDQLETIIELIFDKALAEPHYCETYADLVFGLKSVFPEFCPQGGGRPITFKSSVINICQNEFEELSLEPTEDEKAQHTAEELELRRAKRRDRMCANMRFIGHLFLRQLLSAKVVGAVVCELVRCDGMDESPEEHAIESACELLTAIGYTLDALPAGNLALQQVCGRLLELKGTKTPEGKAIYRKRIQFMIQDLLDIRVAGWTKRSFKISAKTKDEIRAEQERAFAALSRGMEPQTAEHVIAGQRPLYLAPTTGA